MAAMSEPDRQKFLSEVRVGVIAVERPDRAPFAVPIWYAYQPGGEIVLWTTTGTVKEKVIRAAGRFSITVQDEQPPYRYVTAEGDVTAIESADADEARAVAVRYLGDAAGAAFAEQNFNETSIVIRMQPKRWLSFDYSDE